MKAKKRTIKTPLLSVLGTACLLGILIFFAPPLHFVPTVVGIEEGATVSKAAQDLADAHVITNPLLFKILLRLSGGDSQIHSGAYRFGTGEGVAIVAWRLVRADYGLPLARLTFPEGSTVRDMSANLASTLPGFSSTHFADLAKAQEGYLFPDTYRFPASATPASVIATLRTNFEVKTEALRSATATSTHSWNDIVIVASLVEKEARTVTDKRVVAGIIWNRLSKGMPLQVDAVFGYIFNRDTYSPSLADLKADSPYNTYTHKGLPPGPIDNPGLDSLEAAAFPAKTKYLYYLTDRTGEMHYSTTYVAHHQNEVTYLR